MTIMKMVERIVDDSTVKSSAGRWMTHRDALELEAFRRVGPWVDEQTALSDDTIMRLEAKIKAHEERIICLESDLENTRLGEHGEPSHPAGHFATDCNVPEAPGVAEAFPVADHQAHLSGGC